MATRERLQVGRAEAAPPHERHRRSLEVTVLHTTTKGTLEALKIAACLAEGLAAHLRLLVLEVIPYPLAIQTPPVPIEFTRRRFRTIASCGSIETRVDIRLGRDRVTMLDHALQPQSVVVMAGRRRWWPTREGRLVKELERLGHQVVLVAVK